MGIFLVLIAATFVPLTNLFVRKGVDAAGNAKGFFVFQMAASFVFAILMNPVLTGNYAVNFPIVLLGIAAGLILSLLLFCLGRAVEKGPPALTFSILNSATVMPGLIMALSFGAALGFVYNAWHALGSLLVIAGLFWASKGAGEVQDKKGWLLFAVLMFVMHILILALYQWRAMLLNLAHPEEIASFFSAETIQSSWFIPCMFLTSGFIQLLVYLRSEWRMPKKQEILYGVFGGATNTLCTFFLVWSTEVASPLENAVIYPIYSVLGIILTNVWGQKLYQERVNWRACQLSAFGLMVGTVDWRVVAAAIARLM